MKQFQTATCYGFLSNIPNNTLKIGPLNGNAPKSTPTVTYAIRIENEELSTP